MEELKNRHPKLKDLLKLEKVARTEGSGIELNALIGLWKFKQPQSK